VADKLQLLKHLLDENYQKWDSMEDKVKAIQKTFHWTTRSEFKNFAKIKQFYTRKQNLNTKERNIENIFKAFKLLKTWKEALSLIFMLIKSRIVPGKDFWVLFDFSVADDDESYLWIFSWSMKRCRFKMLIKSIQPIRKTWFFEWWVSEGEIEWH
jgi:hypothetical protein